MPGTAEPAAIEATQPTAIPVQEDISSAIFFFAGSLLFLLAYAMLLLFWMRFYYKLASLRLLSRGPQVTALMRIHVLERLNLAFFGLLYAAMVIVLLDGSSYR